MMSKYRIVLFNSCGNDKVEFSNSWMHCKLRMIWLNLTGHSAVWTEKEIR